jgi:hypothetical protein
MWGSDNMGRFGKFIKIVRNIILILLALIILALLIIFIVHKALSAKEYKLLKSARYINSVSAGNYDLNTCIYGNENGRHTIVGISGMGSSDFAVTAKPMMKPMRCS